MTSARLLLLFESIVPWACDFSLSYLKSEGKPCTIVDVVVTCWASTEGVGEHVRSTFSVTCTVLDEGKGVAGGWL
jgi:hypothetical protein